MSATVIIYTTATCPYCERAKALFNKKNVSYTEIRIDTDAEKAQEMQVKSGRRTVPQIFINDRHVGGCDDLYELEKRHELDQWLQKN